MDPLEQIMLRMKDLQPQIPSWAKAEHMEISIPQKELWRYSKDPSKQRNKYKKSGKAAYYFLCRLASRSCAVKKPSLREFPLGRQLQAIKKARDGNRTRVSSLGSWCSAIKLHTHNIMIIHHISDFDKGGRDFYLPSASLWLKGKTPSY